MPDKKKSITVGWEIPFHVLAHVDEDTASTILEGGVTGDPIDAFMIDESRGLAVLVDRFVIKASIAPKISKSESGLRDALVEVKSVVERHANGLDIDWTDTLAQALGEPAESIVLANESGKVAWDPMEQDLDEEWAEEAPTPDLEITIDAKGTVIVRQAE